MRTSSVQLAHKPVSLSVDLHGYTVEEAIVELDKYLDDAFWRDCTRCPSSTARVRAHCAAASTNSCGGTRMWNPSASANTARARAA